MYEQQESQSINEYTRALLKLSQREGEVLMLVAEGKTNYEIADELFLSARTVENHWYHIGKKLGLECRDDLIIWIQNQCGGIS